MSGIIFIDTFWYGHFYLRLGDRWLQLARWISELGANLIFFSRNSNNSQKIHILFFKLTSNSSNKKFQFLPVQNRPGGLQHLKLGADFKFFSSFVNNIQKDAYLVFISVPLTLQIRNFNFYLSPEWTWRPAASEHGGRF